ncbi:unnamed protein product [Rotaria socialis]
MLPIIRLHRFPTYNIKINVADNDFDRYTCIWLNTSQECAGVCRYALALPVTTFLNEASCVLRFRPVTIGYYALALTVLDFENDTSTPPLSHVPIQFTLNVWDSKITCSLPPLYIGDVPADQCIFLVSGQLITMVLRIQIQCPNATLTSIIGLYPAGFTQSAAYTDPYNRTTNAFNVYYTGNLNKVGQNLFCFAGVDSIDNQGDATCLCLSVQIAQDSLNSLYVSNATRFPMGTTFVRPNTDAYVRFQINSTGKDFVTYNIAKQTANVIYQSDRFVILSSVVFIPGEYDYISLDPGVFLPISTCLRDSMGIVDSQFWTFNTPSEANKTVTTMTSANRTVPTLQTIITQTTQTTQTKTTTVITTTTSVSTTTNQLKATSSFPISGIVGIIIGYMILIVLIIYIVKWIRHMPTRQLVNTDLSSDAPKKSIPRSSTATINNNSYTHSRNSPIFDLCST